MTDIKELICKNSEFFSYYLNVSDTILFVLLDKSLKITYCNSSFRKIMNSDEPLEGKDIFSFLLPESRELLPLGNGTTYKKANLSFITKTSSIEVYECHIFATEESRHLILGGRLIMSTSEAINKITSLSNDLANMARELHRKNRELEEAHSQLKILAGIIPICMHCKSIRNDQGYWDNLEKFIAEHSEAKFSHGICPDCMKKYYPEMLLK